MAAAPPPEVATAAAPSPGTEGSASAPWYARLWSAITAPFRALFSGPPLPPDPHWERIREPVKEEIAHLRTLGDKGAQKAYLRSVGDEVVANIQARQGTAEIGFHYNLHGGQAPDYIEAGGILASRGDIMAGMSFTPNPASLNDKIYFFSSAHYNLYDILDMGHPAILFFPSRVGHVLIPFRLDSEYLRTALAERGAFNRTRISIDFDPRWAQEHNGGRKIGIPASTFLTPPLTVFIGVAERLGLSRLSRDEETLAVMRYIEAVATWPPVEAEAPAEDPPTEGETLAADPPPADPVTIETAPPSEGRPALRDVIVVPFESAADPTGIAAYWIDRTKGLLEHEPRLLALRAEIAEGGWNRLGVTLLPADAPHSGDAGIHFAADPAEAPSRHPELALAHPLLHVDPAFLSRLPEDRVPILLEHELRHVLEFHRFPALGNANHGLRGLRNISLSADIAVSSALGHFFLRLHALRDGDAQFADMDIDSALQHRSGVFGILGRNPEPWLTIYTAALLEDALVYEAAGQPEKAEAAARRIEGIFRSWPITRDPAAEAAAEMEKLIQGDGLLAALRATGNTAGAARIEAAMRSTYLPILQETMSAEFSLSRMFAEGRELAHRILALAMGWEGTAAAGGQISPDEMIAVLRELDEKDAQDYAGRIPR